MKKNLLFLFALLASFYSQKAWSQCAPGALYQGAAAPTAGCTIVTGTTCAYNNEYTRFWGLTIGETYNVGNCTAITGTDGGAAGTDLTVRNGGTGSGTVAGFVSTVSGGACLSFVAADATVTVQVNDPGCLSSSNCNSIKIECQSCAAACPVPTTLSSTAITATGATLNWVAPAVCPPSGYQVEYGVTGFTQGSGTIVNVNGATTTTLTGLASATTYQFYVRSNCGLGSYSTWVGPSSFTTLCGTLTAPYTQDFATYLPTCWTEAAGAINATPTGTTSAWAVDGFANVGTTGAARLNIYGTTSANDEWLISPSIDLGTTTDYRLKFDMALTVFAGTGATTLGVDDTVAVLISTNGGTTWTVLQGWGDGQTISNTGQNQEYDLSAYTGVVKFAFFGSSTVANADNDLFIDNFIVDPIPLCDYPINITSSNVTGTSFDVSWGDSNTPPSTSFRIRWGLAGTFDPLTGGGTLINPATSPTSFTGLTPGASYDVFIRAVCGTPTSTWALITVALPQPNDVACSATALTLDAPPICQNTAVANSTDPPSFGCSTPNNTLWYSYTPATSGVVQIVTSIPAAPANPLDGWLGVYDVTDCATTPVYTEITNTVLPSGCYEFGITNGAVDTILTNSLTAGTTYYFMIDGFSGDVGEYCISIHPFTGCLDPSNLSAASTSSSSADLSWTAGNTETLWNIQWDTTGFALGSGTIVNGLTSTSYSLSGLTACPQQYSYYVQADCGGGNVSAWVGPFTFSTTAPPNCATAPVITCGSPVTATLEGICSAWDFDGTLGDPNTCGYSTPGEELVYKFTAPLSGDYTFEVTASTTNGWIDYLYKESSLGCDDLNWTCVSDQFGVGVIGTATLVGGTEYLILLDAEGTTLRDHTFQITCPAPTCGGLLTITQAVDGTYSTGGLYESDTIQASNTVTVPTADTITFDALNFIDLLTEGAAGFKATVSGTGMFQAKIVDGCGPLFKVLTKEDQTTIEKLENAANGSKGFAMTIAPNPVQGITNITFKSKATTEMLMEVLDLQGRKIAVLYNEALQGGEEYQIRFDTSNLPKGMYMIRLVGADGSTELQKLIVQ